ncbi:hypothetical protein GGR57DRAFT_499357 [Xylariaceae sp. FL1272]|nr:hypothetical protein GGR57DRAFT_499357 [Xylariaceae sp. FL1272]
MVSNEKTIVVIGATGKQGGGVARTFLALPNWQVRCITRKPDSDQASLLGELGAEIVKADLSDPMTLPQALAGAHAIFLNTDFWEVWRPMMAAGTDPAVCSQTAFDHEVTNGKNLVDAADKVETLERFVYSSLPSLRDINPNKTSRSFHPESKATIVKYIENENPDLAKKFSLFYAGAYMDNMLLSPQFNPQVGKHVIASPCPATTKMNVLDPHTATGPFVRCLVEDEEPGVKLLAFNEDSYMSLQDFANVWSKATRKEAMYIQMDADTMHKTLRLPYELLDALE